MKLQTWGDLRVWSSCDCYISPPPQGLPLGEKAIDSVFLLPQPPLLCIQWVQINCPYACLASVQPHITKQIIQKRTCVYRIWKSSKSQWSRSVIGGKRKCWAQKHQSAQPCLTAPSHVFLVWLSHSFPSELSHLPLHEKQMLRETLLFSCLPPINLSSTFSPTSSDKLVKLNISLPNRCCLES